MKDIKHVICGYICSNSNGNKLMSFFFEILYASLIFFCLPKKRKIAHSHGMQEINWGGGGVMRMLRCVDLVIFLAQTEL